MDYSEIATDPKGYAEGLSIKKLTELIKKANDSYYTEGETLFDDEVYDSLKEVLEDRDPKNPLLEEVGAPVPAHEKTTLRYCMPSLAKIKETEPDKLEKWKKKNTGNYTLSYKLDGDSAMLSIEDGEMSLYTRGDGKEGRNITHLLEYISGIPEKGLLKNMVIRGELVMRKSTFFDHYSKKYENGRNLVSGKVGMKLESLKKDKESQKALNDIDFVAYELIEPGNFSASRQFQKLKKDYKFLTAANKVVDVIEIDDLKKIYWRENDNYDYEIDGIVVADNSVTERPFGSEKPKHTFAFKAKEKSTEVKVIDVLWEPSPWGYLIPKVIFAPIKLSGVTVKRATAFHAKFVTENKLNKGSIIKIVRANKVIPHIEEVVTKSKEPLMPDEEYEWNETEVHIILIEPEDNEIVQVKHIARFFTKIGVEDFGESRVAKFYKAGLDSINAIIDFDEDDAVELVDGVQKRLANKIRSNIDDCIKNLDIVTLMNASGEFNRGMGKRKIEKVFEKFPDAVTSTTTYRDFTIEELNEVELFNTKTSKSFLDGLPKFMIFLKSLSRDVNVIFKDEDSDSDSDGTDKQFAGQTFVFTGVRDKKVEKQITDEGGKIGTTVSKNTAMVIAKDLDSGSNTITKAKKLKIEVVSIEEFKREYV